MKKSLLFTLLMTTSPAVFSQQYSATVSDLNSIFEPPMNINEIICKNSYDASFKEKKEACEDGVNEARRMAEKHAKKVGKYLGCMDGFYQGVWDGYIAGVNPSAEMIANAQAYVAQSVMESAVRDAKAHAVKTAETESADQIIRRYRDVINQREAGNQVLPDKTPAMPQITFDGFDNGYERDIVNGTVSGGSFNDAINAGYINANSSFENKVAARRAYFLQGQHAKSLCDVNTTIFGRKDSFSNLTIWDYFQAKRERRFEKYGWNDGAWAWSIFTSDKALGYYDTYASLKNTEISVTEPVFITRNKRDANGQVIPVLNEDGTPKVDASGNAVYETEEVFSHNQTVIRKVNANELKQLEDNYQKGFIAAYESYYARQYASLEYHQEGMAKYEHAKVIGKFIGEDVAENVARKNAYDARYKQVSAKAYATEAERLYMESFYRLINIFENNPVVELDVDNTRVVGMTDDNIFTPGEQLKVDLSVINLGEVASNVTLRVDNSRDIISNLTGHTFVPASLERTDTSTGVMGTISNDTGARQNIVVKMKLDNPSNLNEISDELVMSKSQGIKVNEYVEISRVESPVLDLLAGNLSVDVDLINPAKEGILTPAMPKLRVSIAGTSFMEEKNTTKIDGQEVRQLRVPFVGLDPKDIIKNDGLSVRIESLMGTRVTDASTVKVGLGMSQKRAIAEYFNALVTGQTNNTGRVSKNVRIGEVVDMISRSVDAALDREIIWSKADEVDSTIVRELQNTYAKAKSARVLSTEAKENYSELAHLLAKKVRNRGSNRVRREKSYLKELKLFAPGLSIKPNKHK